MSQVHHKSGHSLCLVAIFVLTLVNLNHISRAGCPSNSYMNCVYILYLTQLEYVNFIVLRSICHWSHCPGVNIHFISQNISYSWKPFFIKHMGFGTIDLCRLHLNETSIRQLSLCYLFLMQHNNPCHIWFTDGYIFPKRCQFIRDTIKSYVWSQVSTGLIHMYHQVFTEFHLTWLSRLIRI